MSTTTARRIYNFADEILYSETNLILAALTAFPPVAARLPANYHPDTTAAFDAALAASAETGDNSGELTGLTNDQNTALTRAAALSSLARNIASDTPQFKTNPALLREQFRVGDKRNNLPGIVDRALKIHAACTDTDNAPLLDARGWKATDSTALETAILAVTGADTLQEARKAANKGDTTGLVALLNDLYQRLITIQGAARIEYFENTIPNTTARETFRIGHFPPLNPRDLPTIPKKLNAKPLETGSAQIFVDYNRATRALDYLGTVKNKLTGQIITTFTTTDHKHTLTLSGTPAGTEVEITLIARNDTGTSKPAGPVTAVVP